MRSFSLFLGRIAIAVLILGAATVGPSRAAGFLYVAELSGKIVRIDLSSGSSALVTSGGLLTNAVAIIAENGNSAFVSAPAAHSIVRVNLSTGAQSTVSSGNLLANPDGLAFDSVNGIIYSADFPNARIVATNATTGAQTLVTQGNLLVTATWVVIGPDGKLYVSDTDGVKIVRVDPGTGAQSIVTAGGEFVAPDGLGFGTDGNLYVADINQHKIVRVNPTTGAQTLVSQGGNLFRPLGLGVGPDGFLYTGDYEDGRIVVVNPSNGGQNVFTSAFLYQPYGLLALGTAPPPPTAPAAPATITASDNRPDGVEIKWNDVANEVGYRVFRDGLQIASRDADDTTYFDTPGTGHYQYCVDAFNLGGNSAAVCDSGAQRDFINQPRISFVKDLPNDQGGKVAVAWLASERDAAGGTVRQYRVWRRLPPSLYGVAGAPLAGADAAAIRMRPLDDGIAYWEAVATLPAAHLAGYGFTALTPQDSLPSGNPFTAFFVSALTNDSAVFYDSEIDSGYSVDNLSPAAPTPFAGTYLPDGVHLHWGANQESDLSGYRLYRGTQGSFVPSPANLVVEQADTGYVDVTGTLSYFYKLASVDLHRNQSLFGLVSPYGPTAALATVLRASFDQGRVEVEWLVAANPGIQVEIYRQDPLIGWQHVGQANSDDDGKVVYRDAAVSPGTRYGYRLGIQDGGSEVSIGEAWVDVPALQLALYGIRPNPGPRGEISAALVLASAEPATLELYDVTGRLVLSQPVGGLGEGYHDVRLPATSRLRAGVYVLKLVQGLRESLSKIVLSP